MGIKLNIDIDSSDDLSILGSVFRAAVGQRNEDDLESYYETLAELAGEAAGKEFSLYLAALDSMTEKIDAMAEAIEEILTLLRDRPAAAPAGEKRKVAVQKNGKRPAPKGIYCRYCGKTLDAASGQRIFCSQACAGRWQAQHKGQKAQPRYTLGEETVATYVAGEGIRE